MILESNYRRLRISLASNQEDPTPRVVISNKDGDVESIFELSPSHIGYIKGLFGDYIHLPSLAEWLDTEGKELVGKEDLNKLIQCANSIKKKCLAERDALVGAINDLDRILQIYNRENDNESRTESN